MDTSVYVPPDGNPYSEVAIVGEGPGSEEIRQGRGFVGPSGKLVWPILRRLAGLERGDCYVTNLTHHRLDDDADEKFTPEEFEASRIQLLGELAGTRCTKIVAIGAYAAKALLGDRWVGMHVNNGMAWRIMDPEYRLVIPAWHPAAALRGGEAQGRDPLAWMADAFAHIQTPRFPEVLDVPPPDYGTTRMPRPLAIDTESDGDEPLCMTWSDGIRRGYLEAEWVPIWWHDMVRDRPHPYFIFHNAPWDWKVMEAMGCKGIEDYPFEDTMELAYLRQTEPQALKDLARRHFFGYDFVDYEDVVMPHYNEWVLAVGRGRVDAGTTTTTHSPKTGKAYKKPKVEYTDEVKPLKRAWDNPKLMRDRLGADFPAPSLRFVPHGRMVEYATLDPYLTWHVHRRLASV